jgi:hypothetical protein
MARRYVFRTEVQAAVIFLPELPFREVRVPFMFLDHLLVVLLFIFMQTTSLQYAKIILDKVSFDPVLFEKELIKAIRTLKGPDLEDFQQWCISSFNHYRQLIIRCFTKYGSAEYDLVFF